MAVMRARDQWSSPELHVDFGLARSTTNETKKGGYQEWSADRRHPPNRPEILPNLRPADHLSGD